MRKKPMKFKGFRLTEEQISFLNKEARKIRATQSDFLRELIDAVMKHYK